MTMTTRIGDRSPMLSQPALDNAPMIGGRGATPAKNSPRSGTSSGAKGGTRVAGASKPAAPLVASATGSAPRRTGKVK